MSDNDPGKTEKDPLDLFDQAICRICLSGDEEKTPGDEDLGRLCSPCKCSGTNAFVHVKCFEQWTKSRLGTMSASSCGTCHFRYEYDITAYKIGRCKPLSARHILVWVDAAHERRIFRDPDGPPVFRTPKLLRYFLVNAGDMIIDGSSSFGHFFGDCTYSNSRNDTWTVEINNFPQSSLENADLEDIDIRPIAVKRQNETMCHSYWGYKGGEDAALLSNLVGSAFRGALIAGWAVLFHFMLVRPFYNWARALLAVSRGFLLAPPSERLGDLVFANQVFTAGTMLLFDYEVKIDHFREVNITIDDDARTMQISTQLPRLFTKARWISPADTLFSLPQAVGLIWNVLAVVLAFALLHESVTLYIERLKARKGRLLDYREVCSKAQQA
ncbi:hypothetical protein JCM10207_008660 [Rhodosporidiobolus poonsookiae]